MSIKQELLPLLQTKVTAHFNDQLAFTACSGSYMYGHHSNSKSDIDMMVILKSTENRTQQLLLVEEFIPHYLAFHKELQQTPDLDFPGEYVTTSQIEDAINGRGFDSDKDEEKITLSSITADYFCEQIDNSYRLWLSMMAFSLYVAGDLASFCDYKMRALTTIIKYLLFESQASHADAQSLLDYLLSNTDKNASFGITEKYSAIVQQELHFFELALHFLYTEGVLCAPSNGIYTVNCHAIQDWQISVLHHLKNRGFQNEPLLSLADQHKLSLTAHRLHKNNQDQYL